MVDHHTGVITEGTVSPQGQKAGWCISYDGEKGEVSIGWYTKDRRRGNFMEFKADDLTK